MKKEVKRYAFVEFIRNHDRIFNSEEDVIKFLASQSKYNDNIIKKNNSKYCIIFGNNYVTEANGKYYLTFTRFNRISEPMTLKDADSICLSKNNSAQLKKDYKDKMYKIDNPLYLIYKTNGLLKTIPLLYESDKKYFNIAYLSQVLYDSASISEKVCYHISANSAFQDNPSMLRVIEKYRMAWEKMVLCGESIVLKASIIELVDKFCHRKNSKTNKVEIDYKKFRDMILFVKKEESVAEENIVISSVVGKEKKLEK